MAIEGEREPTVSVQVLRGLIHFTEEVGVSRELLLEGEPLAQGGYDARVPAAICERLCARAMELTGDAALGVHWAEHMSQRTFGPVSHLSAHAPSLREAIGLVSQFAAVFADEPFCALREHADTAVLEVLGFERQALAVQRFASELTVGGFIRLIRSLWAGARFQRLSFAYPAPSYRAEYERVFKQEGAFDQPFTGLVFDRAWLDAPSEYRDDTMTATMTTLAQQRMAMALTSTPFTARVRALLERKAPVRVTMDAIARELGMSERSLRRRLRTEGSSYIEIEDQVLGVVAARLLQEDASSIKEVAHRLGFVSASTFHRAFKRWTGTTPNAVRTVRRDGTGRT